MKKKTALAVAFISVLLFSFLFYGIIIQPVESQSVEIIFIRADGSVEGTDKIKRNGDVYSFTGDIGTDVRSNGIVIEKDNIVVDGAGYLLKGHGPVDYFQHFSQSKPLITGISLDGRNNITIKNLEITGFNSGIDGNCTNIRILGNSIANNVEGIWFPWSSHNAISDNNIINNSGNGMLLESCSESTFSGNNIAGNYYGTHFQHCSNNTVYGNEITENSGTGTLLEHSSNHNIVSGNNLSDNIHGIGIADSFYNIVSGNDVTNNIKYGITLGRQASDNIISGNNITNNAGGIYLRESSNNIFYHNNFNNTIQIYDIGAEFSHIPSSVNIWDYGFSSGGNYWNDYNGTDADGDGIGDTPYVIDENNQDNYPFVNVIPEFPSWILLPLFIIATVFVIVTKKKMFRSTQ